jgi:hypothetical protein
MTPLHLQLVLSSCTSSPSRIYPVGGPHKLKAVATALLLEPVNALHIILNYIYE